jgi:hypothetical protein
MPYAKTDDPVILEAQKVAKREYLKKWRRENREKRRAQKHRQYWKDATRTRVAKRKYYEKNKGRIIALQLAARFADHEATLAAEKVYRMNTPEMHKAWREKHWQTRRGGYLLSSIRKSCKKRGETTDLTFEWLQSRIDYGVCEMSGVPFDMKSKKGPFSPSVDRIDPRGPYTQANCRVILWFINRALSNYGEDLALSVFEKILERRRMKLAA